MKARASVPSVPLRSKAGRELSGGTLNRSDAVMSQRAKDKKPDELDDFPTPPWGTRALCEHIIGKDNCEGLSVLEPAAGRGYMSEALAEYFDKVTSTDIEPYGYPLATTQNFVGPSNVFPENSFDWVITNPPFKLGEAFIQRGLFTARVGVAMLCRTVFIETIGRYNRLYSKNPPWRFAPFTERLPMVEGRVDGEASSATSYAWFVWLKDHNGGSLPLMWKMTLTAPTLPWCPTVWIPPCRRDLERPFDYVALPKDWPRVGTVERRDGGVF